MYAAPLTELEAVNDMLAVIGQAPVNAFTANNSDQNIARQELAKVVREVCAYGFKFNTDEGHTLLPEIDGTIAIPAGAMSVDPMDPRQDLTPRQHPTNGMCLWDAANLSWSISEPVICRNRRSTANDDRHQKIEARVRLLEISKGWLLGAAAALGGIAGFIVDMVKS